MKRYLCKKNYSGPSFSVFLFAIFSWILGRMCNVHFTANYGNPRPNCRFTIILFGSVHFLRRKNKQFGNWIWTNDPSPRTQYTILLRVNSGVVSSLADMAEDEKSQSSIQALYPQGCLPSWYFNIAEHPALWCIRHLEIHPCPRNCPKICVGKAMINR